MGGVNNPLLKNTQGNIVSKSVTFVNSTTGAVATPVIFTVTGFVKAKVLGHCTTNVEIQAGATISVGIASVVDCFIADTAGDALDATELWHDATPDKALEATTVGTENYLSNGQDIVYDISTDTLDSGTVVFYCIWEPISSGATIVVA